MGSTNSSTSDQNHQAEGGVAQNREVSGLFRLHVPSSAEGCIVDIVAVHGLGGDWEETWLDSSTGKMWLRDFIPIQMPKARVFSFGYNSAFAFSHSILDIDGAALDLVSRLHDERQDSAKARPIIFIAHSLGGIIVKRAMNVANERSDIWKSVSDSVIGVFFFAVPHRGSSTAFWGDFATVVVKFATVGTLGNRSFVKKLKNNSETFRLISKAFTQPAQKLTLIRTFYETEKIKNQLIVGSDSATLGLNNEIAVPVQGANHRTICKFDDAEKQKYKPVHDALHSLFKKLEPFDDNRM